MKSFSILMLALVLSLTMISLNNVFAQDDLSITDCQVAVRNANGHGTDHR